MSYYSRFKCLIIPDSLSQKTIVFQKSSTEYLWSKTGMNEDMSYDYITEQQLLRTKKMSSIEIAS